MPRPEDYWISLGENVIGQDVLAEGEQARQAATYRTIAELVVELKVRHLVDVGCNYGVLQWWLKQAGYKGIYSGLDTNEYAIELGTALGFTNLHHGDFRTEQGHCDCIVMKDVIEHLESMEPLREIFKAVERYFILALYLPLTYAPTEIIRHPDGYYTNTYNRQEMRQLANECWFHTLKDIQVKESNGMLNEIIVWERHS